MLWRWIHQFLQNRTIRVVDNIVASDYHNISAGVPQGSVLSPLLLYADDIQLNPTKLRGIPAAE